MLHVLPQEKIPISTLPLDSFISQQQGFLRKKEKSHSGAATISAAQVGHQLSYREEMEELAIQSGLLMIPEF